MSSKLAERENARFGVENETKSQADATFEQAVAETTNAETGMQMRSTEAVANRSHNIADLLSLRFCKTTDLRFQFRR